MWQRERERQRAPLWTGVVDSLMHVNNAQRSDCMHACMNIRGKPGIEDTLQCLLRVHRSMIFNMVCMYMILGGNMYMFGFPPSIIFDFCDCRLVCCA